MTAGTHPHQWVPPKKYKVFHGFPFSGRPLDTVQANMETFVTHNGDFELFKIFSKFYELAEIQDWLERVTYCKRPGNVDSAAIAGTTLFHRVCAVVCHSSTHVNWQFPFNRYD